MESPLTDLRIPEEEHEEIGLDEEEEEEDEDVDDEEELDVDEDEDDQNSVGKRSGRGLTLKTLLKEKVLEPGDGNMTINYLGNKFKGDLLPDGRIRSQETSKIFGTPSAWAIYCKKIVNPEKKSGCGWASVRYRGKKLDAYKNNWFRQKRLEFEKEEGMEEYDDFSSEGEETIIQEQQIMEFDQLGNKSPSHDSSTMIELSTFQGLGRMQPFNITMSSSAMAVIDVHSHLTTTEVVGYLAGQWDVNNHNLIVSHAFPVRCNLNDIDKGAIVEQELYTEMARLKLSLVGWYHTHPTTPPIPSLRDIDSQLDYEIKMKGYNDASYTPVLGIIVSPYQKSPVEKGVPKSPVEKGVKGVPHLNGNASGFWVMPPPENKPLEYGRPMSMQFTIVQDAFIPKEALVHMTEVVTYYKDSPAIVTFCNPFDDKLTYWHKLKYSLRSRVPKDHLPPLVEFLTKLIDEKLPEDDPIPLPPPPPPPIETKAATEDPKEHSDSISLQQLADLAEKDRSSPKIEDLKTDGKTPPKSYSPLFQLPLPPLFPIDVAKPPTSSHSKESPSKSAAVDRKFESVEQALDSSSKSDVLYELASKLRKKENLSVSSSSSSKGFLDLSLFAKDTEKSKKEKDDKMGSSWLAQAKMMQEALENPFAREVPQMFPPEFLTAQWNPTAAAAALHLARESFHPDVANLFTPKCSDSSKPTYHSDVPLILKKQDDDDKKKGEFRVPRDVKDARPSPRKRDLELDSKDARSSKEPHLDTRSPIPIILDLHLESPIDSYTESIGQQLPSSMEKRVLPKAPESSVTISRSIPASLEVTTKSLINLGNPNELLRTPATSLPDELSSSLNELRKLIDSKNFSDVQDRSSGESSSATDLRSLVNLTQTPSEEREPRISEFSPTINESSKMSTSPPSEGKTLPFNLDVRIPATISADAPLGLSIPKPDTLRKPEEPLQLIAPLKLEEVLSKPSDDPPSIAEHPLPIVKDVPEEPMDFS